MTLKVSTATGTV